jgi:hypothetical protein
MNSNISGNQFMTHVLNYLTLEYELQLAMMERRFENVEKPLTIEEIRIELSLRYERLNMKSTIGREAEVLEHNSFFSRQFKGKCRNYGQVGHKSFPNKNRGSHHGEDNGKSSGGIYDCIVVSLAMMWRIASSSRRRIHDPTMTVPITVILTDQTSTHMI